MELTTSLAFEIFSYGADYGQLKMEEERDNEDIFNSFIGYQVSRKTAMPVKDIQRRQPHSEKWRDAKTESFKKFKNLIVEIAKGETK